MKRLLHAVDASQQMGTQQADAIITVSEVSKVWPAKAARGLLAISPVSLSVPRRQFTVILGPSGCGKSTLLRMIAGLETPTNGTIVVLGNEVKGPGWERGMMFQDYALFPWRTVLGNVMFGPEALGRPRPESEKSARELIALVGLSGFEDHYPAQLSGGMQQRASLARALANDPEVLLMDEPFSAVDSQTRETLQDELLCIWQVTHKSIVFVTHDIAEAVYLADRVIIMAPRPGRIKSDVSIDMHRPRDRISSEFTKLARRMRELLSEG